MRRRTTRCSSAATATPARRCWCTGPAEASASAPCSSRGHGRRPAPGARARRASRARSHRAGLSRRAAAADRRQGRQRRAGDAGQREPRQGPGHRRHARPHRRHRQPRHDRDQSPRRHEQERRDHRRGPLPRLAGTARGHPRRARRGPRQRHAASGHRPGDPAGPGAARSRSGDGRGSSRQDRARPMTRHFGVLIPSTNTTVEIECRLLPATYQAHVGRLMSSGGGSFSPSRDEDIDYQSRLLGTAKVEIVILAQTSASLFAEDYDDVVTKRMSSGAGVPAITSAQAVGRAVRALGAGRVAIVSPYSEEVNQRAARYFEKKHGLATVALEGFGATDAYAIGKLGPQNARDAFARIDRPEIEAFVVPGGNFPTMPSVAAWEREFKKPVVTTNQAALWAVRRRLDSSDRLPGLGRLLAEVPADDARSASEDDH